MNHRAGAMIGRFISRSVFILAALFLLSVVLCPDAAAGDWLQWRGPQMNGSTHDAKGLPEKWSSEENILWIADMPGEGASTPIIDGDQIFLTSTSRDNKDLYVMSLNSHTGKELWRRTMDTKCRTVQYNRDAAPSPVVDEKMVFCLFGTGDFIALDYNGKVIWKRNIEKDFGPLSQLFLYSASPLLYRDRLYLSMIRNDKTTITLAHKTRVEGLDSFLLCVDPATGKDIWKQDRPSDTRGVENRDSYATPIPCELEGRTDIIQIGADYLTGNDWLTGREVWRMKYNLDEKYRQRVVPTPLFEEGLIIAIKPRAGAIFAIKPGGIGDLPYNSVVWEYDKFTSDTPSPLYYRGRLYFLQDSRKRLTCMNPVNGQVVWQNHIGGDSLFHASPTGADGKIYCVNLSGEVAVFAAGDEFREISRNSMGGKPCMATIAVANNCLFIRTEDKLYCVGDTAGPAQP